MNPTPPTNQSMIQAYIRPENFKHHSCLQGFVNSPTECVFVSKGGVSMSVILPLYSLLGYPRGTSSIWFPRLVRFGFPWCPFISFSSSSSSHQWEISLVAEATVLYSYILNTAILLTLTLAKSPAPLEMLTLSTVVVLETGNGRK